MPRNRLELSLDKAESPAVADGFSFLTFGFFASRPLRFWPFAMIMPSWTVRAGEDSPD